MTLLLIVSLVPSQANITFGLWRDINPSQYTSDAAGTLRGTYVRNGGSGAIGAGDGWAVGGDVVACPTVVEQCPIIAHYDGFSWPFLASPIPNAVYYGVNFCTNPGAPGVGLCSPNGDGSDGWLVGADSSSTSSTPGTSTDPPTITVSASSATWTAVSSTLVVDAVSPTISTLVSPASINTRSSATDLATLTGGSSPTGWITFNEHPNPGYTFTGRPGSGTASHSGSQISVSSDPVSITVTSSPSGTGYVTVDSTPLTTPVVESWNPGDTHALVAAPTVSCGTGCQYTFQNWSSASIGTVTTASFTYTVPASPETVTATYQQQYQLTMALTPSGAGTTDPAAGTSWENFGASVPISVAQNSGFMFTSWTGAGSGSYTGTSSSSSVTMNAAITETANFDVAITVTSSPAGTGYVTVDSVSTGTPQGYNWNPGDTHALAAISPVSCGSGCQYVFQSWSSPSIGTVATQTFTYTVPSTPETVTANFQQQYQLTMAVNPSGDGTTSPSVGVAFENAGTVSISATANGGNAFTGWTGSGTGSYTGAGNPSSVTMNGPITETADFVSTVTMTVSYSVTGGGAGYTAPWFNYVLGGSPQNYQLTTTGHALSVDSGSTWTLSQTSGGSASQLLGGSTSTEQWVTGQSGTGTASATTIVFAYQHQYYLTMTTGAGGTVTPASGFQNAAASISITATPAGAGFTFISWTGTGSGSFTGTTASASVSMNAPITETASFAPTTGVAVYWNGAALTTVNTGLSDAANLTSVFMVCHSPEYGSGCPSSAGFVSGLTYAVGTNITSSTSSHGSIWAFSGDPKGSGGWIEQTVVGVATDRYNSVYMFRDSSGNLEGFAVGGNKDGSNGVVARLFDGGHTWTATSIGGSAKELLGVFVDQTNPIDAWAVGRGGQIWHFSNGIWAEVSPGGTSQDLYSIQLVSTSEGWIVGADGAILHSTTLQGSNTWLLLTQPIQTAVGVGVSLLSDSFPGSGNGWAVGSNGVILQTSNSACGSAAPQPCWGGSTNTLNSPQLNAVWEVGSSDAWAGGMYDPGSLCCSLVHWDGVKWHRASVAPTQTTNPNIWTIYMLSSGEGWALGGNAANTVPEALLWNGQSWTGQPISTSCGGGNPCEPRSVFMISGGSTGDGWAVGLNGEIWRHQSGSWLLFSQPTPGINLNSVFINNPGASNGGVAGWAVGNTGTVLALTITGGTPTWVAHAISAVGSSNLHGVYFIDSNHGWIVGSGSTIVQTTDGGNTWSGGTGQVTDCCGSVSTTANLTSVFVDTFGTGSGNGDGWVVGDDQTGPPGNVVFAHWDGVSWDYTPLVPPILAGSTTPGMSLRSVYLTGPQDGWAVGAPVTGGTLSGIIHLDPPSPPIVGQQVTSTTSSSTSSSSSSSSNSSSSLSSSSTGATTVSSSLSSSTSSNASTTSGITTGSLTTTVVSTSASTMTVVSTPTTTSSSTTTSVSTSPIPGFPWESIIVGMILGVAILVITRRYGK